MIWFMGKTVKQPDYSYMRFSYIRFLLCISGRLNWSTANLEGLQRQTIPPYRSNGATQQNRLISLSTFREGPFVLSFQSNFPNDLPVDFKEQSVKISASASGESITTWQPSSSVLPPLFFRYVLDEAAGRRFLSISLSVRPTDFDVVALASGAQPKP